MDLGINKRFNERGYLQAVDFNYSIQYKNRNGEIYRLLTQAVLHAYAYDKAFRLPHFEMPSAASDYYQIDAMPYNSWFWEEGSEFGMKNQENEIFIRENLLLNRSILEGTPLFKQGMFEFPYTEWSPKRLLFQPDMLTYEEWEGVIPSDRYHLQVQFFLDVTPEIDSVHWFSRAVFDPVQSFYRFPKDTRANCLLNMYVDLMEIQHRQMLNDLKEATPIESEIERIYQDHVEEAEVLSRTLFRELDRGRQEEGMLKWNAYIRERLGIDNLAIFQIGWEEGE